MFLEIFNKAIYKEGEKKNPCWDNLVAEVRDEEMCEKLCLLWNQEEAKKVKPRESH